jgi:Lipocalin-like domain
MKQLLSQSGIAGATLIASLAIGGSAGAGDAEALVGNWKLVSWQVVTGNQAQDLFGAHPKGYLILTREGRAVALTTAENRKGGEGDAERAALHKSMLAYTGRYRIEGSDFVTTVDVSWNESWNGSEQRRHYRVDGDKLFIESAPAPSITSPGKTDFRRIVWVREN